MIYKKSASSDSASPADFNGICVAAAAFLIFLYVALRNFSIYLYDQLLIIPCLAFLLRLRSDRLNFPGKRVWLLPVFMVSWFVIAQVPHSFAEGNTYPLAPFAVSYLFAFPFAFLQSEPRRQQSLQCFGTAYLAAALCLCGFSVLLFLDIVPQWLDAYIGWDGARLSAFWHPNIFACFLLIGIVFCTAFLAGSRSPWQKAGFAAALALLVLAAALTSCRTIILLIGAYLGSCVFFAAVQKGRFWILPGAVAAAVLVLMVFNGSGYLYQKNHDALLERYTAEYYAQHSEETQPPAEEAETIPPVTADPETAAETEAVPEADIPDAALLPAEDILPEAAESAAVPPEDILPEAAESAAVPPEEILPEAAEVAAADFAEADLYEEFYYDEYDEEFWESEVETLPITIDPDTGELSLVTNSDQSSLADDLYTLNNRIYIWSAARFAIRENPSVLLWGVDSPGDFVSGYNFFYTTHTHNSWVECLMGLGLPGLLGALVFTLLAVWNALVILLRHHRDMWKRSIAMLTLCLLAASVLEPYLFYSTKDYHPVDFLFFLCTGYLVCWQTEDNRRILAAVRKWLHI